MQPVRASTLIPRGFGLRPTLPTCAAGCPHGKRLTAKVPPRPLKDRDLPQFSSHLSQAPSPGMRSHVKAPAQSWAFFIALSS
jgi:hypothetical protein